MSPNRRATLAGLGAILALPKAAHAAADPLPSLWAETRRLGTLLNEGRFASEAEADTLMDQWGGCCRQAVVTPATTAAGALASIEWAKDELQQFGFDPSRPDNGTSLVLALLDGAAAALRQTGGAA